MFRRQLTISLAAAWLAGASAQAAELLTIEQAEARSRETGRPILAMAGSKT